MINFHALIGPGGLPGAREKFERLIAQLVCVTAPARRIRPNPGDWGIDVVVGDLDGVVDVWQAKFFLEAIGSSQRAQIRDSFERAHTAATEHGYSLRSWTLCIPTMFDAPGSQWWDSWRRDSAAAQSIDVGLWDQVELERRLMAEEATTIRRSYFETSGEFDAFAAPRIVLTSADSDWPLAGPEGATRSAGPFSRRVIVGRDKTADVMILGPEQDRVFVSRYHLVLEPVADRWFATCIGKHGWQLAADARQVLRKAMPAVPYPVVDGMRLRLGDDAKVKRHKRPVLEVQIETGFADTQWTPDSEEDSPSPPASRRRELWEQDVAAHDLAVQLLRKKPLLAEVDRGVLASVALHVGVPLPAEGDLTPSASALVAALQRDPSFGTLPQLPR